MTRDSHQSHPLQDSKAAALAGLAKALYLHVPFCFHKCHYCDFYSLVDRRGRQDRFADRLCAELRLLKPHARPLTTVFVGGGTPTLLREDLWRRLLTTLNQTFELDASLEFTVECNPETINDDILRTLKEGGVNRLSIGAQSFNLLHLKTLERWHDPASVRRGVKLAHKHGFENLSLDLIFAIPGQTLGDWRDDLQAALNLGIPHLSCYNLTYEPGTAMFQRLGAGEITPVEAEIESEMYELAIEMAAAAGLKRYEISNFALPGRECRHNLAYWACEPYLAAGPSASGHLAGWRWKNAPDLTAYLDSTGFPPTVEVEPPDADRALAERLMMGLRTVRGVEIDLPEPLLRRAETLQDAGCMTHEGRCWRLTDAGLLQADSIIADLMALI